MRPLLAALGFVALVTACSPYSPDLPITPFLCGDSAPICPDGFACQPSGTQMICVESGGSGSGSGVQPDAGSNHGNCNGNDRTEPNDSPQQPFQTTVATDRASIDLAGLEICPATDVDFYEFTVVTEGQNADATMIFRDGGAALQMAILVDNGGSGATLLNGTAVSGMPNQIHAAPANLPAGIYYVKVSGADTNTYELKLAVSGP